MERNRLVAAVTFSALAAAIIFNIYLSFSSGKWLWAAVSLLIPVLVPVAFAVWRKKRHVKKEFPADGMISIFDAGGVLRLSLRLCDLYYIESDDNYIKVWYSDSSGGVKNDVIRCRMKSVESSFRSVGLMRVHRKYIVNSGKVRSLRRGASGSCFLDLDMEPPVSIPVTKTYRDRVTAELQGK